MSEIHARAQKVFTIAGNYQTRIHYEAGDDPIYVGIALRGIATTDEKWFIQKLTWSSSKPTLIQSAIDVDWDNRTTHTYS